MMIHIFHSWVTVVEVDHSRCGSCFQRRLNDKNKIIGCPHSFKVCRDCGKVEGYGSHGKLTVVPDGCKQQIQSMGGKC